ncbi:MAG TPA: carbohydrate ABC transporter permease [Thermomicrobiales bacterium]|nr:carbohydrate ABC transporter permease [Thermomicrobiales bacterium]
MSQLPAMPISPDSAQVPDGYLHVPRKRRHARLRSTLGRVITHVTLILLTIFALAPLAWAISSAFKTDSEILTGLNFLPTSPTLKNFTFVLGNTEFPTWIRNSLLVSLGTTIFALTIGSLGGYAMSRWRFRGRTLYGNTLLTVQMFPGIMLAIPLYLVLTRYGLIDTLWALLVTYLTFALATAVWMLKGYFDAIPREIEEAALIDGANRLQILWKIVLPLAGPGITTVAVFVFLLAWNEFFFAYVFLASPEKYTLSIGMYSFIQQFTTQWGNIMAAGTLTTLPVLLFFFLLQRTLTRGLIAGAMKG